MSNLSRAIAWASLGCPVFPCYEEDKWVGEKLHLKKSPYTKTGLNEGTTDLKQIEEFWTKNPSPLVGVVAGESIALLDIDMNEEKGKDGWFSLTSNEVPLPETFHIKTLNGGDHYFYKYPKGKRLGPLQNIVLPNGVILEDVDRRAGRSYFIAWSDEVPSTLDELTEAPLWLCTESGTTSIYEFNGSVNDWLEKLSSGSPDGRVQNAINRIPKMDFNHQEMIKLQVEFVRLGAEGHQGVRGAIEKLQNAWLRSPYDTFKNEADWNAALAGAVSKYGGASPKSPADESEQTDAEKEMKEKIERYVLEGKAKLEAQRIIAAENFQGTRVISWEELETSCSSYIVQDLVPEDSICFLVAKRNLGKTFAYIDMVCSIVFGLPWLSKPTKQVPILIVLGEGRNGFVDRVKTWCEYHGKDFEYLKKLVTIVDSGNLNNSTSIQIMKEAAELNKAELLIFDTWAASSGVANEDDAALNSMTMNSALEIRKGASYMFVHHPRKSDQNSTAPIMRGSGALEGRAEVVMTMFQDKDYGSSKVGKQAWMALSTEMDHAGKNRTARTETIRGLYLRSYSTSAVLAFDSSASVSKNILRVLDVLKSPMTVNDFVAASGLSQSTGSRYLNEAVQEGLVTKKDGSGTKPAIFSPNKPTTIEVPDSLNFGSLIDENGGYDSLTKPKRGRKTKS